MALELLGAAGNAIGSIGSSIIQNEIGKQNEERQWNRYYSPKAQVKNLAAAGINPAVAFGNQSPQLLPGGSMQSPTVENLGLGTTALSEIGAYINAKSTAAKTEKETGKVDAETKKLLSELDAQELQNDLVRQFGNQKWTYDVAQAYQNVLLAKKTNDIKEQEKAINEYHKVTAYLESNLKGTELQMVKKRLGNLDKQIELENKLQSEKIATEKSAQSSNYAAATASRASADLSRSQVDINKELKEIRRIEREVADTGKFDQIDSLLSRYRADKMIADKEYEQARKLYESARYFNEKGDKSKAVRMVYAMFDLLGEEIGNISPIKPK